MTPAISAAIGFALSELAKTMPGLIIDLIRILNKPDATDADYDALVEKYSKVTYDQRRNEATARAAANIQ